MRRSSLAALAALAVLFSLTSAQPAAPAAYGAEVASSLNPDLVRKHASHLAALGSRVVGYPGYYEAARYLLEQLGSLGYSVEVQEFRVASPVEVEAYIEVGGERLPVHAVWPNAMFVTSPTPPEGVSGKLVYVGKGEAGDMNGKDVEGSIVLMDFNSGDNWLRAADLGARAVVFIEPDDTSSYEALAKFVLAPVHFTRAS